MNISFGYGSPKNLQYLYNISITTLKSFDSRCYSREAYCTYNIRIRTVTCLFILISTKLTTKSYFCQQEGMSQQNVTRVRRFQRELEAAEDRADCAESNLSLIRAKHRTFVTTSTVPGSQVYLVQESRAMSSERM